MCCAAILKARSREGETNGKGPLDYVYGRLCDRWFLYCSGSVHHLGWFSNQRPNHERPLRYAKSIGTWQLPRCVTKFAVLAANEQLGDRGNLHHPGCGRARRYGQLRDCSVRLPRSRPDVHAVRCGAHVPDDRCHHAALHFDSRHGSNEQSGRLILPQIAFALPTTVIILVPFLRAIPKELEEAASIDGSSRLGFFFRMVVPLSIPGVITTGILAFVASWNSYILPLFILNNEGSYTLPLGVQAFASQYSVDTARVLAFTALSMIPALIFFSLFERRIVGGLTGAVKG